MRLISDELEICSPVSTYLDRDTRGNRRKVYEVEVSKDMAWRVRKSMQTFGEQLWPGHIKIWEKPARPEIPVALMEAMAMGLPVVSTHHSGIPELIENGVSGFLVPEKNVDALFHKLKYLVKYPHLWPELGRRGRSYVEVHYNINKLNDRLVEIYQRLLK